MREGLSGLHTAPQEKAMPQVPTGVGQSCTSIRPLTEEGQRMLRALDARYDYLQYQIQLITEARDYVISEQGRREGQIFETIKKAEQQVHD